MSLGGLSTFDKKYYDQFYIAKTFNHMSANADQVVAYRERDHTLVILIRVH